ncbi:MAG: hypothetical protein KF838_01630 [Phycisphaeraceae bacterium]|nr:MAG: hypothetical protein KF838_01630 [Phycisphaeraceae bacterium]
MRRPSMTALLSAASLTLLAGLCHAADPVIADVAPSESMLVVSVKDWSALKAQFDRTGMKTLWATNEVQALVKDLAKDAASGFDEMLQELGVTKDDMVYPSGSIGMAMFFTQSLDAVASQINTLEGDLDIDAIFLADFGDDADKFADLIEKVCDFASDKHGAEIRQTPHGGHTITSIIREAEADDANDDEFEDFDFPGVGMMMPFESESGAYSIHIVRLGSTYLAGDSLDSVQAAIDRAADAGRPSIAEDTIYIKSLAQHPADAGATVFFRAGDALKLFAANTTAQQREWDETAPDMSIMFDALGLLSIQSTSFGIRLDTPAAMAEATSGILVPEKKGILSLLSRGTPAFQNPSFVSADVSAISQIVVDFSRIPAIARGVIETLPEDAREQARMALAQAEPIALPIIEALGSDIYIAQTITQPLSPDSQKALFAIRITDSLVFTNLVTAFGAQIGLQVREFQGTQIFEQDMFGITGGISPEWLFIGQTSDVEDALRRLSAPGDDQLNAQPEFKSAVTMLRGDAVLNQYQDTERAIRYTIWSLQNQDKIADAQLDALDIDEEFKQQIREARGSTQRDWARLLPPPELITEHIGDTVTELRPTPDGYRGQTLMLRPKR